MPICKSTQHGMDMREQGVGGGGGGGQVGGQGEEAVGFKIFQHQAIVQTVHLRGSILYVDFMFVIFDTCPWKGLATGGKMLRPSDTLAKTKMVASDSIRRKVVFSRLLSRL